MSLNTETFRFGKLLLKDKTLIYPKKNGKKGKKGVVSLFVAATVQYQLILLFIFSFLIIRISFFVFDNDTI